MLSTRVFGAYLAHCTISKKRGDKATTIKRIRTLLEFPLTSTQRHRVVSLMEEVMGEQAEKQPCVTLPSATFLLDDLMYTIPNTLDICKYL